MELEKAIEILKDPLHIRDLPSTADFNDAVKLGIEALNYVLKCRVKGYHPVEYALPGETEE